MTRGRYDALARALCGDTRRGHRDGDYCQRCTPISDALARAHAEGLEAGRREMLRVLDEAVTTLEAPRNGPQYGEIHEVIEAARQGVLTEYLLSQDGDLARILAQRRSLIPAAPEVIK